MGTRLPCVHLMSFTSWMLPGHLHSWKQYYEVGMVLTLLNSFMFVESSGVPKRPMWLITVVSSPPWLSWINSCREQVMWQSCDNHMIQSSKVIDSNIIHHQIEDSTQEALCPVHRVASTHILVLETFRTGKANWGFNVVSQCWVMVSLDCPLICSSMA